jgi:hypothetical protein
MPVERCWKCQQTKPEVSLAPSDDRLCTDCYEENKRQLNELRKPPGDDQSTQAAGATGKTRSVRTGEKKPNRKPANKSSTSDIAITMDVATATVAT